jgi:hypothetical protein
LPGVALPNSLQFLILGECFNESLQGVAMPNSLQRFVLLNALTRVGKIVHSRARCDHVLCEVRQPEFTRCVLPNSLRLLTLDEWCCDAEQQPAANYLPRASTRTHKMVRDRTDCSH